jgi:hypothetical protein
MKICKEKENTKEEDLSMLDKTIENNSKIITQYNADTIQNYNINIETLNIIINEPKEKSFIIYSLPTVNDSFVYTKAYISKVKTYLTTPKTEISMHDQYNICGLYLEYLSDVYFNNKYPQNYTFQYKTAKGDYLMIKEKEQWFIYTMIDGIDLFIEKSKLHFKCFMNYLIIQPEMSEYIETFNMSVFNGKVGNMFKGAIRLFLSDFGTLIQLKEKMRNDKNGMIGNSEQAKRIYKQVSVFMKSKLYSMYNEMKSYREKDVKKESIDMSNTSIHFLENYELEELETMKHQLEQESIS